jgi:hypothetical protein
MEPAIYTTWADLDSNPLSRLEDDLEGIQNDGSGEYPLIIFGSESVDEQTDETKASYKKLKTIEDFMNKNNYVQVYENDTYRVYNRK